MKTRILRFAIAWALVGPATDALAQQTHLERLPADVLDVPAPFERIAGEPGQMRMVALACESGPMEGLRRRIIDVAVQEWAFFGFSVSDRTGPETRFQNAGLTFGEPAGQAGPPQRGRRGFGRMSPAEFGRVVESIAGYWAATPDGAWMIERQNDIWAGSGNIGSRWRDPWSAAFISWVMCEAGLGSRSQFQRSIAHRDYIDQAIRARDGQEEAAAFVAYDPGEAEIIPGDLLCSGSRPDYRTIDERRRQMGDGARTHCDIVVRIDASAGRILTIGGNVRGTVSLKQMPAAQERGNYLHPRDDIFAHLKLRAGAIDANALNTSPTIAALGCATGFQPPAELARMELPNPATFC
jgi:hypothetical protein